MLGVCACDFLTAASEHGSPEDWIDSEFEEVPGPYPRSGKHQGFDCSGLMIYAYAGVVALTHYSGSGGQFATGTPVAPEALEPGDLVFFEGARDPQHVGMFVGGGKFINAPKSFIHNTTAAISDMIGNNPRDSRLDAAADYVRVDLLADRTDYAGARSLIPDFPPGTKHK